MKILIYIFFAFSSLFFITEIANAQIKTKVSQGESITLYEYDRYDKDGNTYKSIEAPTTELRYECPICKGASVLNINSVKNSVPIMVSCWRCNGKGYLVSNSGKQK
ncbi:MAG TPA: hypothetical protein VIL99_13105 [Ignavibacteria bacterium]|jgi:hypothetical protein